MPAGLNEDIGRVAIVYRVDRSDLQEQNSNAHSHLQQNCITDKADRQHTVAPNKPNKIYGEEGSAPMFMVIFLCILLTTCFQAIF